MWTRCYSSIVWFHEIRLIWCSFPWFWVLKDWKSFFSHRHSKRENLCQQTLGNSWTNAFGFGSIAIEALTNHPKPYNRCQCYHRYSATASVCPPFFSAYHSDVCVVKGRWLSWLWGACAAFREFKIHVYEFHNISFVGQQMGAQTPAMQHWAGHRQTTQHLSGLDAETMLFLIIFAKLQHRRFAFSPSVCVSVAGKDNGAPSVGQQRKMHFWCPSHKKWRVSHSEGQRHAERQCEAFLTTLHERRGRWRWHRGPLCGSVFICFSDAN